MFGADEGPDGRTVGFGLSNVHLCIAMSWLRARASWFIPACIAVVACDNVAYNEAFCASYKKSFMQSCTVAFETSFVKECANTTPLTGQ